MNYRYLIPPLLMLVSLQANAADVTREVERAGSGAFAEIDVSLQSAKFPLVGFNNQNLEESGDQNYSINLSLEGRIEYKGVFAEIVGDSFSNITLGYQLVDSQSTSIELIGTNLFGDVERNDREGLESIEDREGDFNLGFRSSWYSGDGLIKLEVVKDVTNSHRGVIGALHYGRQKQIKNWNLHGLLGVRYYSENVVDHFFGVSAAEATDSISQYKGEDGFTPSIQIGATLPLSEKWLFKTRAEYLRIPDSISDSPLAQGDSIYIAQIGFSYIFGGR